MTRPQETFTDMLARLFPMPGIQLGINSPHSKCITFQVTEDCNLRCSYCYQGCKTRSSGMRRKNSTIPRAAPSPANSSCIV